jgi:hypothetical protein
MTETISLVFLFERKMTFIFLYQLESGPGTDVMIIKIVSPKKWRKIGVFWSSYWVFMQIFAPFFIDLEFFRQQSYLVLRT